MSKLKIVFAILTIFGVGALTVTGSTPADVGILVTVGIGAGTAVSAIIAILKRR